MAAGSVAVRPTIDRAWLERASLTEPVAHAYARWDLERYPDRVRFFSAIRGDATVAYLLIWPGRVAVVVHYVGAPDAADDLAPFLPPRPLVLMAPEEVGAPLAAGRAPAASYPVLLLAARPGAVARGRDERVRRLVPADRPALLALVAGETELVASGYPEVDLEREAVWGSFEAGRLAGVARNSVVLPDVWILSGVFVAPDRRGRGHAQALVRAVLGDAASDGVTVGLYVREDRPAARAVYDRAGFRLVGRRRWIDAGANLAP